MKQQSRRDRVLSFLLALLFHSIVLFLLFFMFILHQLPTRQRDDDESITLGAQAGTPGANIIVYQAPTQSTFDPMPLPHEDVAQQQQPTALLQETTMEHKQDADEPSPIDQSVLEPIPTPHPLPSTYIVEHVPEQASQPQEPLPHSKKIRKSAKKKRQEAMQALQGLSFAQIADEKKSIRSVGNGGYGGKQTDVYDIVYSRYVHKIIHMMGMALNAENMHIALEEDVSCHTTLCIKIRRDGRMTDFHFEAPHHALRMIEGAIRPIVQSSAWFYLPIPQAIKEDLVTVSIPVHVKGNKGLEHYYFSFPTAGMYR